MILCLFAVIPMATAQMEDVVKFTAVRTKGNDEKLSESAKVLVCAEDLVRKSGTCRVLVTATSSSLLDCDVVLKFKDETIATTVKPIPAISTSGSAMITLSIPKEKLIEFDQFDSILYIQAAVKHTRK